MKKFNLLKIGLLSLFVIALSCNSTDDNQVKYEGESLLHFNKESESVTIVNGGDDVDLNIEYSTIAPVSGNHTVSLVFDQDKSTAVLNQDFIIVSDDQISTGEVTGSLVVRYLSSSSALSTVAVFNLQSSSLTKASFKQEFTVNSSLTCPVPSTSFVGNYLIEEITPFVDGPTLSHNTVVSLIATSNSGRRFMTANFPNYCSSLMAFNFDLVCGKVVSGTMQGNCSCNGNYFFKEAISNSTYNVSDDSVFELTFTNDSESDCGSPVQTTYRFTKQ